MRAAPVSRLAATVISTNAAVAALPACGPQCAYRGASHDVKGASLARHYVLDPAQLPASTRDCVLQLSLDDETRMFLDSCRPRWLVDAAAGVLRSCLSVTDVNGLLGRGQMFVLSGEQMEKLLGAPLAAARAAHGGPLRLLDVGAGDGEVTARLSKLFGGVTATEVSRVMCHRLARRGFTVRHTPRISADVFPEDGAFDVVSCMNLLDRCDFPAEMLRDAARLARRGTGRVLLAVVLPFSEFVEEGAGRRAPRGALPMRGARCSDGVSLEASLTALVERVLIPLGLEVERLSRVPYLCRGDSVQPFYVLSDALLVLKHAEGGGGGGDGGGVWDGCGALGKSGARALEDCDALLLPRTGAGAVSIGIKGGAGAGNKDN